MSILQEEFIPEDFVQPANFGNYQMKQTFFEKKQVMFENAD